MYSYFGIDTSKKFVNSDIRIIYKILSISRLCEWDLAKSVFDPDTLKLKLR